MILTPKQIEKAVEWWANDIQNSNFHQVKPENDTEETIIARDSHTMNFDKLSDCKIEKFKDCLRELLKNPETPDFLSVDYHPSGYLEDVAYLAGIPEDNFSFKTEMIFYLDGTVSVSHGCGGEFVII